MTGPDRLVTEEELHALVDGEIPKARTAAVEAYLTEERNAGARVEAYRRLNRGFHALFDVALTEPIPERLRPAAIEARRRRRWVQGLAAAAAAILLLALGGVGGWLASHQVNQPPGFVERLTAAATLAHRTYIAERRHAVEVPASDQEHLFSWLSNRLEAPVLAPPLAEKGFTFVGGRMLPSVDGNAAQFLYEDAEGKRLTLYVARNPGLPESQSYVEQADGLGTCIWVEDQLAYVVLAELAEGPMLATARTLFAGIYDAADE